LKKNVYAVRGAITADSNTVESINEATLELLAEVKKRNGFLTENVVSFVISTTLDLTATYPAKAVRESGMSDVPVFSCLEPDIDGGLERCIRFLITVVDFTDSTKPKHVYLKEAKKLRTDLE
jgi:chorismate mutase